MFYSMTYKININKTCPYGTNTPRNNNPCDMDNNLVKYHPHPSYPWKVMVWKHIFAMCKLWHWPWWYMVQGHDRPLGHGQHVKYYPHPTLQWGVMVRSQILGMSRVCHDLYPWSYLQGQGDMTLGKGHDTPLGHGQQLCKILSRSVKGVRSYGPDTMWTDGQTDRVMV